MNNNIPMDISSTMPTPMQDYLFYYGWHFNKAMFEYAVSKMTKLNPATQQEEPITPMSKEDVDRLLSRYGVKIKNDIGYDAAYVANMCKADFFGSSIIDEHHMILYIKDVLDDVDGAPGHVMRTWYYSMLGKGRNVFFEDFL